MPTRKHGSDPDLIPFVAAIDLLSNFQNSDGSLPNMHGKSTTLQPGEHDGIVRPNPDGLAPAIRATFSLREEPMYHY